MMVRVNIRRELDYVPFTTAATAEQEIRIMIALRTISLALVLGACAAGSAALAGDLPSRTTPTYDTGYQPVPQKNWTGPYVGAVLGGGMGKAGSVSTSGFVGGVQGGYNMQFDKIVAGGEADIMLSDVNNKSFTEKVRTNSLGTVRARAGYLVDPSVMVYGTGGLAWGNTENQTAWGTSKTTKGGWVLGAGGEYMVQPNVTVKGEYLYYNLGNTNLPTNVGPVKIETTTNVLRAGVNYKF
jgi:outer membrane immunogenic protein